MQYYSKTNYLNNEKIITPTLIKKWVNIFVIKKIYIMLSTLFI